MSCLVRCLTVSCAALLIATPGAQAFDAAMAPTIVQGSLQAVFAPSEDVEGVIVDTIDHARTQVLVQAYLLTSKKIASALIAAKRRGIDVRILADAEQHARTPSSKLAELSHAGIAVWLETKYENAHNKIVIIDADRPQATIITGSFNFTWTAQHKNAENILVARNNSALAARYALNWERHRQEATPYGK